MKRNTLLLQKVCKRSCNGPSSYLYTCTFFYFPDQNKMHWKYCVTFCFVERETVGSSVLLKKLHCFARWKQRQKSVLQTLKMLNVCSAWAFYSSAGTGVRASSGYYRTTLAGLLWYWRTTKKQGKLVRRRLHTHSGTIKKHFTGTCTKCMFYLLFVPYIAQHECLFLCCILF